MREIDPKQTKRSAAFDLWMHAPMPMVTIMQTMDVSHLVKLSRKKGLKFHMLLCYCIGKAASRTEELYLLPVGEKLIQYDKIVVNTIVLNKNGEVSSCDIPFCEELEQFRESYDRLTKQVQDTCENHDLADAMVIGTSALPQYELDGIVNLYSGCFNNPFLHWGKYRRKGFKKVLPMSFQFHHTQMDGIEACEFLRRLQEVMNSLQ